MVDETQVQEKEVFDWVAEKTNCDPLDWKNARKLWKGRLRSWLELDSDDISFKVWGRKK